MSIIAQLVSTITSLPPGPLFIAIIILLCTVSYFFSQPPKPTKTAAPQVVKKELKEYTKEEVAKHSTPEDLWLIIDGKVFDFTPFYNQHPGGDAILRNAGADSTTGFRGPHHPSRVEEIMDDYLIGTLKA